MSFLPHVREGRHAPSRALPRMLIGLSLLAIAGHGFAQATRPRAHDCRLAAPPHGAGGRVTGDAPACRALQKSLPAGCLRRRLAAGAMPADCIAD